MNLDQIPRRIYSRSTPIEKLDRLSRHFGGPDIYIKRDDLLELAGGGNKTRKLEYMVAHALEQECDTLITCGAIQSNHCRLTLAAAVRESIDCRLILEERVPGTYDNQASGNNLLFQLLRPAELVVMPNGIDEDLEMQKMGELVKASGGKPYVINGSNACGLGSLGYVICAREILAQLNAMQVRLDHVVVPSGSGGTHGGLLAGLLAFDSTDTQVLGINVRREKSLQIERLKKVLAETFELLEVNSKNTDNAIHCFDDYLGPGYSIPAPETIEAIELLARLEGILLDPIYSGKTMAGLIDLVRNKHFANHHNVLFLHTGGIPALYAYKDLFLKKSGDCRDERI